MLCQCRRRVWWSSWNCRPITNTRPQNKEGNDKTAGPCCRVCNNWGTGVEYINPKELSRKGTNANRIHNTKTRRQHPPRRPALSDLLQSSRAGRASDLQCSGAVISCRLVSICWRSLQSCTLARKSAADISAEKLQKGGIFKNRKKWGCQIVARSLPDRQPSALESIDLAHDLATIWRPHLWPIFEYNWRLPRIWAIRMLSRPSIQRLSTTDREEIADSSALVATCGSPIADCPKPLLHLQLQVQTR